MTNTTVTPVSVEFASIAINSILIFIGCVIAVLNITVLYASLQISLFQKSAYHNLVIGLTFSDTCGALGLISNGIRFLSAELSHVLPLCIVTSVLVEVGLLTSFNQTFLICLNRYFSMSTNNWNSKLFDSKFRYVLYIFHWMAAILLSTCFFESESMQNNKEICTINVLYGGQFEKFRVVFSSVCICIVLLTIIFYVKTVLAIRGLFKSVTPVEHIQLEERGLEIVANSQSNTAIGPHSYPNQTFLRRRAEKIKKTTMIVGIILGALICLTGPMLIINVASSVNNTLMQASLCLAVLNSLINPIIYCINIRKLREKLKSMFTISNC